MQYFVTQPITKKRAFGMPIDILSEYVANALRQDGMARPISDLMNRVLQLEVV